jgi:hypothetical protein
LIRFADVRKNYLSPRIIPLMLMYMNSRFYKFLRKTISDLRRWR